jgi:hypothetical protein
MTTSTNQTNLVVDDSDDDVTAPGNSCLPTKLITFEELQMVNPTPSDEEYYRHLSDALDAALNL